MLSTSFLCLFDARIWFWKSEIIFQNEEAYAMRLINNNYFYHTCCSKTFRKDFHLNCRKRRSFKQCCICIIKNIHWKIFKKLWWKISDVFKTEKLKSRYMLTWRSFCFCWWKIASMVNIECEPLVQQRVLQFLHKISITFQWKLRLQTKIILIADKYKSFWIIKQ